MCEDYNESEDYESEDNTVFADCTCGHEAELHGWGCCEVEDCDCKGGWEE